MNEQVSSTTVAKGPALINFFEFSDFATPHRRRMTKMDFTARKDLDKMLDTIGQKWHTYVTQVYKYKNPNGGNCPELYKEYTTLKDNFEQMITWAVISGHLKSE